MMKYTQKSLLALALLAALATPLAMAQGTSPAIDAKQTPPATTTSQAPTATNPSAVQDTLKKPSTSLSRSSTGQKTWEELDANKDGKLSKAEADADASMKSLFAKADADSDGILTPEEYRAYYEKYVAKTSH
jgi:hypothetical protein